jgi:hypothetical protein
MTTRAKPIRTGRLLTFNAPTGNQQDSRRIAASDHKSAANADSRGAGMNHELADSLRD